MLQSAAANIDRNRLRNALIAYNDPEKLSDSQQISFRELTGNQASCTIVTGQQLTIAGGPLFTVYKLLTAVHKARKLSETSGVPVIPIFWLADEDHDFHEIAHLGIPFQQNWLNVTLSDDEESGKPAGIIKIKESWGEVYRKLDEALVQTDFKDDLTQLINNSYKLGKTHMEAFGGLISAIFAEYGVLLAGSAHPGVREELAPELKFLISKTTKIYEALESASQLVEERYHRQAAVSQSNWFWIDETSQRVKMAFHDEIWTAGDKEFTTEALLSEIDKNPGCISPNVFMRPLLQDMLLPNAAYVAGPGEVAYYAQMRSLYAVCDMKMPVIIPRFSFTIFEPAVSRVFDELPFEFPEYANRIEDLEKAYIEKSNALDIQKFHDDFVKELAEVADARLQVISSFDASLVGTLERIKKEQESAVDSLRQKMMRAAKSKQDVQIKRLAKVQMMLFPNRNLQEREMASLYLLNKYGKHLLDTLLEVMNDRKPDHHFIIRM